MTNKQDFINAGFEVIDASLTSNQSSNLLEFLQEHYPQIIQDGEIKLNELKQALNLPIDYKNNGYGLNFIGRNYAKAKYMQATNKEPKINQKLSKNFNETENVIIKGDNLDSLKILLNSYRGKIKCIYIDPPYNTKNEGFIYPDKFDREELEVLGFENINDDDYRRMEFSFSSKNSHNGWLSFIYPRLKLARDLLANDGIIFVSIDDNEQANLKILMDEVFGEGCFLSEIVWHSKYTTSNDINGVSGQHEYILSYVKDSTIFNIVLLDRTVEMDNAYKNPDNDPKGNWKATPLHAKSGSGNYELKFPNGVIWNAPQGRYPRYNKVKLMQMFNEGRLWFGKDGNKNPDAKTYLSEVKQGKTPGSIISYKDVGSSHGANEELAKLVNKGIFDNPKPVSLVKHLLQISTSSNDLILDFFAGSGTTAQAVMELNKKDGGNRKFILCQIDEPINEEKKKEAFDFCLKNGLEPVISSITIERVKRAGEKILTEIKEQKNLLTQEDKGLDAGFKVFDLIEASKIIEDANHQFNLALSNNDSLSKIYHLILKDGVFDLNAKIKIVIDDCLYLINDFRYYIINAEKLETPENKQLLNDILIDKNKDFIIDGFTASINLSLQQYQNKSRFKIIY